MEESRRLDEDSRICVDCIADELAGERIEDQPQILECAVCGDTLETYSLSDVAEAVRGVFETFVTSAEDEPRADPDSDNMYWVQGGDTPSESVQEILGCDSELADAIVEHLEAEDRYSVVRDGTTDYYSSDQQGFTLSVRDSEPYAVAREQFNEDWRRFESDVKHRQRFFNAAQSRYLESIFGPLLRGELTNNTPPIVPAGPRTQIELIYRGREASDEGSRRRIYANPSRELAPPPPRLRRQGRMNATGISAFYACSDRTTCVAELRVPVGGAAVVGTFRLLRAVRLLDLRRFEESEPSSAQSWFDPNFASLHAYADFMRGLHDLIRKPVLPGDEVLEYLPTQMIAEFLANHELGINGLMFSSSLITRDRERPRSEGLNIVLFSASASVVGDRGPAPYQVVSVQEPWFDDDHAFEDSETVTRRPILPPPNDAVVVHEHEPQAVESTLELVENETRVVRVRGIRYDVMDRGVDFG